MDVYSAIYSRRTVRDFKEKEIEIGVLKKIIRAGLHAPSHDHMRQWEFVIVNDSNTRSELIQKINRNRTGKDAIEALNSWGFSDNYQREMYIDAIPKQYKMLLTAGCLIIPCFYTKTELLKPNEISSLNPFAAIWCCIENILLAATAEGIFGVTRIPSVEETKHIKKILNIPAGYEVPCYLALGYPLENVEKVKQHSINEEERLHNNVW
jgi:nitroreductase